MSRAYGTGSMMEVRPGVWRLRVYVGRDPVTGNARQASHTVRTARRGGKSEAAAALRTFVAEASSRGTPLTLSTTATLGRLFDEWVPHLAHQGLARSTIETYSTHIRVRLRPKLGAIRLDRLTAHDLDTFYGELLAEGLAVGTVKLQHAILSGALSQAVRWGWMGTNPAKSASPPRGRPTVRDVPSIKDIRRLIAAARADDIDLAVFLTLAAVTGARRGEVCGLRWSDVDWGQQTLLIERALVPGLGGQHLGGTKSGAERLVAIGTFGTSMLAQYREVLIERLEGSEPSGWLISYDGGATAMRAKAVTEYVSRLGHRLDPPVSIYLHQLRHFNATWLVGAGTDVRTVAGRLGHASTSMTLDVYSHRLPAQDVVAAEALGAALQGE